MRRSAITEALLTLTSVIDRKKMASGGKCDQNCVTRGEMFGSNTLIMAVLLTTRSQLCFSDHCLQSSHVKLPALSSKALISAFSDELGSSVLFSKAMGCFTTNAHTYCLEPRSFAAPNHTLTILSGDLFASSTHLFTSAHLLVSFASESQHGAQLVNLGHL